MANDCGWQTLIFYLLISSKGGRGNYPAGVAARSELERGRKEAANDETPVSAADRTGSPLKSSVCVEKQIGSSDHVRTRQITVPDGASKANQRGFCPTPGDEFC